MKTSINRATTGLGEPSYRNLKLGYYNLKLVKIVTELCGDKFFHFKHYNDSAICILIYYGNTILLTLYGQEMSSNVTQYAFMQQFRTVNTT